MGQLIAWNAAHVDAGLLILRLAVGIGSFIHGMNKVGKVHLFAGDHHLPNWLAAIAMWVQIIGGACLVLGFATFPAALGLVIFYLVATQELIVRKKEPFARPGVHTWDSGLLYLAIPLAILVAGPGRYSLDALFFAR